MLYNRHMIGDKMREVLHKHNLTNTKAAEMMGISQPRLALWLSGRNEPSQEHIKKFCDLFNTTPNYLMYGESETNTIPVIGYVQAGLWQEAHQWNVSDFKPIYMPVDDRFAGKRIFALEIRGNSMNLLYPAGSCVVCVSAEDYADVVGSIESGKKVVVQRKNPFDNTIEATVKEYVKNEFGTYLMPHSTDPSFTPIRTDDGSAGEVKITAVVIGSFRRE